MKSFLLSVLIMLVSFMSQAQLANAVIFSEAGEKFTVYLNGEQQNETPTANVKLKDLTSEFFMCKVVFENMAQGEISMRNFAVQFGMETTYVVKVTKKGEYVLRYYNVTPLSGNTAQEVDQLEQPRVIMASPEPVATQAHVQSSPQSTTTVTTTTTSRPSQDENVNVTMNVPGVNVNFNMNVTDPLMDVHVTETTSVTTTSTTTTTTSDEVLIPVERPTPVNEPIISGTGCASNMAAGDFKRAKDGIESKSFSDTKMTVAKQAVKGRCPSSAQIKDLCGLFSFEADKLTFAKFAYDHAWDQQNYFEVFDAFTFESSIEELSQYIEGK